MAFVQESYDVAVVGAGHAGCEAALACARLGLKTIVFTVSVDSIALMPCNPNIGGSSKGHLVRELDALGGEMGKNIDKTFIQSKMLNKSKGPAVHSLRAQADKQSYTREMRKTLENQSNLTIRQAEISEILTTVNINSTELKSITGVKTSSGAIYKAKAVILCTGVYLNSRCLTGDLIEYTGPNGLRSATHLTDSLKNNGVRMFRFKTGTPARVDRRSLDFSKFEVQKGDVPVIPFSFSTKFESVQKEQIDCWLVYTNEKTHNIIRDNISRSPMFNGSIEGVGPRYCPSIEDKVMKFPDKNRHQIFIEPEGLYTNEMYLSGMSSSMPEDVQYEMYHSMEGFEHVHIVRNAYAIEYDCIDSTQLKSTLEFKSIDGLFAAGQFNGSSGYEEAAVQGLMAGINASMKILGRKPVVLDRSQAYIGVLIDDLVTKENFEPYRMMTSRSEYRLLLRQDNADIRLRKIGHDVGLVSDEEFDETCAKIKLIEQEINRLNNTFVGNTDSINDFLFTHSSNIINSGISLAELVKRPELNYESIGQIDLERPSLPFSVREEVNIEIKYEGYIKRQLAQVEAFKKLECKKIPKDIDYNEITNLRLEARQKLSRIKPDNVGMAGRISGVSPADISVLLIYIESYKHKK
ncbi:tRNA uridine-5-carboxymethylaminomethyl(34) synthesis enzyme MnmG [Oribacterium sp. WCC10]|uniref:tRNA uridine-5-carboxymethylaminomethyl(34) synthesis enzyme MnmG n=1 Tax=Oribacterium sp. WCC10 TaxID=1855343 RepID=UPI0008E1519E|nr:tRNA uridine-5-carboxymethylaminomethyl(34) synthesis enzyme MnmG [Oribacterium sp. WCC10]SFG72248.1 tRNA uridine 5-carboxymethylaminomethyl modification enzyme [Oribacterium sp. WCC10]